MPVSRQDYCLRVKGGNMGSAKDHRHAERLELSAIALLTGFLSPFFQNFGGSIGSFYDVDARASVMFWSRSFDVIALQDQ